MNRRALKTISFILIPIGIIAIFLTSNQNSEDTPPEGQSIGNYQIPITLPTIDNQAALDSAKNLQEDGVYRFAKSIPVQITPLNHGSWETLPSGGSRWTLEVQSPGASSLNFGFSRYAMPEGGSLTIQEPGADPAFRSFTSADNETHGQLWTPLLHGDSAIISLDLADENRSSLILELASVNHGFRSEKIGGGTSGSCNIDVNCDSTSLPGIGSMIEMFDDQIRSVAAYTLNGTDTCTGALINNTANDRRPFFLTANHCDITTENAPSMVVFWNFQNSTCRTPNSAASGGGGDGNITQFNTGAIFRAGNSATDFTLVELDDPIENDVDPFYAGWDRTGATPQSAIGIHHPAVAEKRISFTFTPTQTTSHSDTASPGDGNFVRIVSWDNGTTEGGSSGSPLFDPSGRIIGQLFGGFAACENNLSDWYGRISRSWNSGRTSTTRLSNWLDPIDSGETILDGINKFQSLTLTGNSNSEDIADNIVFTVSLREQSNALPSQMITVNYMTSDGTAQAGTDYTATSGTLSFAPGETSATISVPILRDTDPEENETFELLLSNAQPSNAVFITSTKATATILNDDFIKPVFTSATSATATIGLPLSIQLTAQNTPTTFALSGTTPPEIQINATSGIISWIPTNTGQINITVSATNPAGTATSTLLINVAENPLLTAIDNLNFSIDQGISPTWVSQSTITFDGIDAIRSAELENSGISEFILETEGRGVLEFYWRVSSEAGFDILNFTADGESIAQISGEIDWQRYALKLGPGSHRLAWTYTKNSSDSRGSDAGWLDAVKFVTTDEDVILFSIDDARIPSGSAFAQHVDFTPPTATLSSNGMPTWLRLSDDGFLTGTSPPEDNTTQTISLTASQDGISSTTSFNITTNPPVDFSEEVGSGNTLAFFNANDTPWRRSIGGANSGSASIRSGDIDHNESSSINASVMGPATLTFAWRVNSEPNFDRLLFSFNGTLISQISGDRPWETFTFAIPVGHHEIQWHYIKDLNTNIGDDRAYLDSVYLSGYGSWITSQAVSGFIDPSYDPDGDRRINFMEYALGTNPAISDPAERLTYNFETTPPTISLEKPLNVEGVQYSLETSADLDPESWTSQNSEIITNDDTSFIAIPTRASSRMFMRLSAQSVEP